MALQCSFAHVEEQLHSSQPMWTPVWPSTRRPATALRGDLALPRECAGARMLRKHCCSSPTAGWSARLLEGGGV